MRQEKCRSIGKIRGAGLMGVLSLHPTGGLLPVVSLYLGAVVDLDADWTRFFARLSERNCHCGADCLSDDLRAVEALAVSATGDTSLDLLEAEPGFYTGTQSGVSSAYEFNLDGEVYTLPSHVPFTATAERISGDSAFRVTWIPSEATDECMWINVVSQAGDHLDFKTSCDEDSIDLQLWWAEPTVELSLQLRASAHTDEANVWSAGMTTAATRRLSLPW